MNEAPAKKKVKQSNYTPFNILVVPWKTNKRLQLRKSNARYAKLHKKPNFQQIILSVVSQVQKTSDREKLKIAHRHYCRVSFMLKMSERQTKAGNLEVF